MAKNKLLNKNNAFTLAELLAVITILGVIALIVFPAVNKAIKNSKEKSYNQQIESILDSAENWTTENMSQLSDTSNNYITIDELQQSGYLEAKRVINPKTDEEMNGCIVIKYDNNYNQYAYEYNEISCDELKPKIYTFQEIMENSKEVYNNDPDSNLRYVGTDPDNYVWFNNELWRIIGVFDGQAKIIRNDLYRNIEWDKDSENGGHGSSGWNDWTIATLQVELNGTYLNSIETISKSYIDETHEWNLGGIASDTANWTRENIYNYERESTVYTDRKPTWEGAIGLMYPSDYGYATNSNNDTCDNTVMFEWNSGTAQTECSEKSWLYKNSTVQWTITSASNYATLVFSVYSGGGHINSGSAYSSYGARPALYLQPEVVIIDGTGTSEDPYILDM